MLVLDSDSAGREASARLRATLGDRVQLFELPEGVKDVNELGVRPEGRATFFSLLDAMTGSERDAARAS